MSVEYLFTADIRLADEAARRQGWRVHGRSGWIKPDGVEIHFIEEQLSVVGEDVTIYFVGDLSERFRRFKRKWTRLHR
jgi:calcineurin-like phosphoesterase family protein